MPAILADYHDQLRTAMQEFEDDLQQRDTPDMLRITRQRIGLFHILNDFMTRKVKALGILKQSAFARTAEPLLRKHDDAARALFLRYSEHIKVWTPASIQEDWPGYRESVLTLQGALREQMEWDEQNLHPLLRKAGAIRERDEPAVRGAA